MHHQLKGASQKLQDDLAVHWVVSQTFKFLETTNTQGSVTTVSWASGFIPLTLRAICKWNFPDQRNLSRCAHLSFLGFTDRTCRAYVEAVAAFFAYWRALRGRLLLLGFNWMCRTHFRTYQPYLGWSASTYLAAPPFCPGWEPKPWRRQQQKCKGMTSRSWCSAVSPSFCGRWSSCHSVFPTCGSSPIKGHSSLPSSIRGPRKACSNQKYFSFSESG